MVKQIKAGEVLADTKSLVSRAWSNPNVKLAVSALIQIGAAAALATVAYKRGKKAGEFSGEVKGYGLALNDIGIQSSDVPEVRSAWAEGQAAREEAIAKMISPSAVLA